ncbi:MAG: VOC family protein [Thermomicrobiales bacterium]
MVMPAARSGKICYIEIPATDIGRSAAFYERAFEWKLRTHDDGATAFDDTTGQVSGMWVLNRPPASEPGFVISIMVADAKASVDAIIAAGGEIVRPIDPATQEVTAWFRDPAGNVMGIYQQDGLAEAEAQEAALG